MADNGATNWPSTDGLNKPSDATTRSPLSAGDGNYDFDEWTDRVTGELRALEQYLFGTGLVHNLAMGTHKVTGLAAPTTGTDATTKTYVDAGDATRSPVLTPTSVKSTNYTAAAGDFVPVDTTSGAITVTLPTAPADGTRIGVKLVIQGGTNAVTIARGGSDVFNKASGSTSLTLSLLFQAVSLQYKASGAIWYVVGDDLPLGDLDARYVASVAATDSTVTVGGTASAPTVKVATGGVTTTQIADGTIVDADIDAAAAIADSKLALTTVEKTANKGANSGYMGLDASGIGSSPPKVHNARGSAHTDLWIPTGAIADTFPYNLVPSANSGAIATGKQYFAGITLPVSAITSITFSAQTTLLSGGTHQVFSIYDQATLNKLAVTADDIDTAWAAQTVKTLYISRTVTDAAITTGTATLTSATAAFTNADTGRRITVLGAGAAGATLGTSAAPVTMTYVNATTVTLSTNASTTVSGATAYIATPYTPPSEGRYYLGIMVAGTPPSLTCCVTASSGRNALAPVFAGTDNTNTGLTTPASLPSPAHALTAGTALPYAYVS